MSIKKKLAIENVIKRPLIEMPNDKTNVNSMTICLLLSLAHSDDFVALGFPYDDGITKSQGVKIK